MSRTGLIAEKVGMTRVFTDAGVCVPVTVLKVDECRVVGVKTTQRDGYTAVQLGVGEARAHRLNKAERGQFAAAKVKPAKKLKEFRVSEQNLLSIGDQLSVDHFIAGQCVDVTGTSIGKGFAGAMKRHNFGGLRASHGVSVSHRSHGSTGQNQDPGRVFKGKKMAGHMGNAQVTMQNLEVVSTDASDGLILVKGVVPGCKGTYVYLKDAVKMKLPEGLPFPAALLNAPSTKVTPSESVESSTTEDVTDTQELSVETEENSSEA